MFDAVARRCDITNTVLSAGQDRYWRRATRSALAAEATATATATAAAAVCATAAGRAGFGRVHARRLAKNSRSNAAASPAMMPL
mgnify:CR=1 FL=1